MSAFLLSTLLAATATATPASPQDAPGEHLRFGEGRVAELYAGPRAAAPEDKRQWLTLRLGEVGLVVVSDDGKSEILSIDKFGGVYVSGDLYVKGARVAGAPAPAAAAPVTAATGSVGWMQLLLTALVTAVVSILVSTNISKRQPR